jgi:hypothetical protein
MVFLLSSHGLFLSAEPSGRVVADKEEPKEGETWYMTRTNQRVTLMSAHGKYLCAEVPSAFYFLFIIGLFLFDYFILSFDSPWLSHGSLRAGLWPIEIGPWCGSTFSLSPTARLWHSGRTTASTCAPSRTTRCWPIASRWRRTSAGT